MIHSPSLECNVNTGGRLKSHMQKDLLWQLHCLPSVTRARGTILYHLPNTARTHRKPKYNAEDFGVIYDIEIELLQKTNSKDHSIFYRCLNQELHHV